MNEKVAQEDPVQEKLSEDTAKMPKINSEQKGPDKEKKSEQEGSHAKKVFEQFDQILINNIERLLQTNQGINELPINLYTFSCIILIAARETEIESFPYLPPERYVSENIIEELAEIGIEPGQELDSAIDDMIDKDYIEIASDGRFFAKPPAISMSKLIDRIFPKMPGLNLFAYLGQMMDEVQAERKSLDYALDQFRQILEIHGVSIKGASPEKSEKRLFPHLKVSSTSKGNKKSKFVSSLPDIKPTDIFSQLKTVSPKPSQGRKDPVSSTDTLQHGVPHEDKEDTPDSGNLSTPEIIDEEVERESGSPDLSSGAFKEEDREKAETSTEQSFEDHEAVKGPSSAEEVQGFEGKTDAAPADLKGADLQLEDDDIEKKIAALEEQLGITCPLCQRPGIKPRVTARGKEYYSCSNEECNFISWGKPYYVTCPRCNNPFLVEATGKDGKGMLKCPRATCPHWQEFPWEGNVETTAGIDPEVVIKDERKPKKRRLVRRRRVVRRKK